MLFSFGQGDINCHKNGNKRGADAETSATIKLGEIEFRTFCEASPLTFMATMKAD